MKDACIIIPARFGSTRFPGKPLVPLVGKPMLHWVIEAAKQSGIERIIVATDDERIRESALQKDVEVFMTDKSIETGTERVAKVASKLDYPYIINLQGDEPLMRGEMIRRLYSALKEGAQIATLARKGIMKEIMSPQSAKVVVNRNREALYFSRAPIPYIRDEKPAEDHYLIHIGIYGFRRETLLEIVSLPESPLEKLEKLEQLKALYYGYKIKVIEVPYLTKPVDLPEDVKEVEKLLRLYERRKDIRKN